jgi:hypothetical protein
MAKLNDDSARALFAPHLDPNEQIKHWAFGVKQPNLLLIIPLIVLAVVPGLIAMALLTKNYLIGLTSKDRLLVLRLGTTGKTVKEIAEYPLAQLRNQNVKTSTGPIFTHIAIRDPAKPFRAKFHRAYGSSNRPNAVAIADAISAPSLASS